MLMHSTVYKIMNKSIVKVYYMPSVYSVTSPQGHLQLCPLSDCEAGMLLWGWVRERKRERVSEHDFSFSYTKSF